MINVSADDLAAIITRIDEALALHDAWRETLSRVLICKLPAPPSDLGPSAHELCGFGRWLYGKGNAHLLCLPALRKIESLHKSMHARVRELYEQRLAGHVVAVEDFDAYARVAAAFRGEMLDLKARVAFTLDNVDPLTGAFRQSQLPAELSAAQQRLREAGEPCGLLLIDLDLREVNLALGQGAGDLALRAAIGRVRDKLELRDRIYRLVGAQFAICLPGRATNDVTPLEARLHDAVGAAVEAATGQAQATVGLRSVVLALAPDADPQAQLDAALRTLNADAVPG